MNGIYRENVAHGALIGDKHTWRDWRLVPKEKLVVKPPAVDESSLKIPGRHGTLRTTTALTGDVVYGNRSGSWSFRVQNRQHCRLLYSEILEYVHGKELQIILDDDRYFYYKGALKVEGWEPGAVKDTLTITYDLQPFKMERDSSLEDWLWDTFDFDVGIAREYHDLAVSGIRDLLIPGRRLAVCPSIYASEGSNVSVAYAGAVYPLHSGQWNLYDGILLGEGDHTLRFTGTGTVSVDYRGGRL